MAVLSANPLRVAPAAIKDIVVLATLKEGVLISPPRAGARAGCAGDGGRRRHGRLTNG